MGLKAIAISFPLLIAIAFRIARERQLYRGQYRKEAKNQCAKPIQKGDKKRLRARTFAIAKLEKR